MKHISNYILESVDNTTKQISKVMLDELKKPNNLKKFVDVMNKLLDKCSKQDNAALWYGALKSLFDGTYDHGQKYTAVYENVPVKDLYPTQSEIDIENSAKWLTNKFIARNTVENVFMQKDYGAMFGCPVLVYNDKGTNWIIDGHHRWSQVGLLNYDGSLYCLVVKGPASVQDFLKIVQGTIASVIADESNPNHGENGHLPVGKARPQNDIFGSQLSGDKLKKRILELLEKEGTEQELCERVHKFIPSVTDADSLADFICENRDKFIKNDQAPRSWAASRPVMPQTDTASPNGFGEPGADKEGSAIWAIAKRGHMPSMK